MQAPKDANTAALGQKVKQTAPPPSSVTLTVLNGNGVQGAAANASYLLGQRGYRALTPPNNLDPNYTATFHSKIYFDPAQKGSRAAAVALQNLMQPADIAKLPRTPKMLALDPGSMLMVVLGQTFHGTIVALPARVIPTHQQATVRYDASAAQLLRPYVKKVPFKLMVPTVLERYSSPDTLPPPATASPEEPQAASSTTCGTGTRRGAAASISHTPSPAGQAIRRPSALRIGRGGTGVCVIATIA